MKKLLRHLEMGLQGFVALSAIPSGILMMIFPRGYVKEMPVSMLEGSPFHDFFWPGLILFTVMGLGHTVALIMSLKRHRLFEPAAAAMGLGLMIWIFVQVNMIGGGHWLQALYFALGTAEVSLAVLLVKEVTNPPG